MQNLYAVFENLNILHKGKASHLQTYNYTVYIALYGFQAPFKHMALHPFSVYLYILYLPPHLILIHLLDVLHQRIKSQ